MIRSGAFQREGNGRVGIKEWFAAGKSDLQAPEVPVPFLQLCKSLNSSIRFEDEGRKILGFWRNLGKPLLEGGDEVGRLQVVCKEVGKKGLHWDLKPHSNRRWGWCSDEKKSQRPKNAGRGFLAALWIFLHHLGYTTCPTSPKLELFGKMGVSGNSPAATAAKATTLEPPGTQGCYFPHILFFSLLARYKLSPRKPKINPITSPSAIYLKRYILILYFGHQSPLVSLSGWLNSPSPVLISTH